MNKIIQDMIPAKNKPPLSESIPVERPRAEKRRLVREKKERREEVLETRIEDEYVPPPRTPRTSSRRGVLGRRSVRPRLFIIIAILCICAIVYGLSIVYARATVAITPATIDIPISGTYTAYANSAASGTLAYKIIQSTAEQNQTVPASVGPVVTTYAKGTVILYNNYGTASQKIIAGTRLSSGNGLIYTTNTSVIVPGVSKGVAGSAAVNVTAASGGPSYDILPSDLLVNPSYGDFNVVAYKGGPKYAAFYARLNPNGAGITGGSSGHQVTTSSSTVAAANQVMEQSLQKNLLAQAQALVPAGYVMPANAYNITFATLAASGTSSTSTNIGVKASFYGIIFKKDDLAQTVAPTQYNSSFDPQDLDSTQLTIDNPQSFTPVNNQPLNFTLSGSMNLVGIISTTTLARQLAGISLSQSAAIFKGYSQIATAHVTIVPFWKRSFPGSVSRINIVVNQ